MLYLRDELVRGLAGGAAHGGGRVHCIDDARRVGAVHPSGDIGRQVDDIGELQTERTADDRISQPGLGQSPGDRGHRQLVFVAFLGVVEQLVGPGRFAGAGQHPTAEEPVAAVDEQLGGCPHQPVVAVRPAAGEPCGQS